MSANPLDAHVDEQDAVLSELLIDDDSPIGAHGPQSRVGGFDFFQQLPVDITLEVASATLPLSEIAKLGKGDVVALDKAIGEPVDILVNGRKLGRGEVVDVDGRSGIRVLELESQLSTS